MAPVSADKYQADIAKGCSKSAGGTYRTLRWPDEIPGLGPRCLSVFSRCSFCPPGIHISVAGTWCTYGGRPVCEACAIDEAARRAA